MKCIIGIASIAVLIVTVLSVGEAELVFKGNSCTLTDPYVSDVMQSIQPVTAGASRT